MRREVLGLALAGFVVLGFVSWVSFMPKPSTAPLQGAAPAVQQVPVAEASAAPAATEPVSGGTGSVAPVSTPEPTQPAQQEEAAPAPEVQLASLPDEWAEDTSAATHLRVDALRIYADVAAAQRSASPGCTVEWNHIAALADPTDVTPLAIDATSRAVAGLLCGTGVDVVGQFGDALRALGRSDADVSLITTRANAYASAAT